MAGISVTPATGVSVPPTMSIHHPPQTDHETDFHDSPLSPTNRDWLAGSRFNYDSVVTVERLRREYEQRYFRLMTAVGEHVKRAILTVTVTYNTTTYRDILDYVETTLRTVKNHVHDLRDATILRVGSGRPAAISFANSDLALLAEDVLSFV